MPIISCAPLLHIQVQWSSYHLFSIHDQDYHQNSLCTQNAFVSLFVFIREYLGKQLEKENENQKQGAAPIAGKA